MDIVIKSTKSWKIPEQRIINTTKSEQTSKKNQISL